MVVFEIALYILAQSIPKEGLIDFATGNTGVILILFREEGDGQLGGTEVEAHWDNDGLFGMTPRHVEV